MKCVFAFFFIFLFFIFYFFAELLNVMNPRISSESIQLVEKYLKYSSSATFNHFVAKEKDNITNVSKYIHAQNAFNLMIYWVNAYNEATSYRRPTAKLQSLPKTGAPTTFKSIFNTSTALAEGSDKLKNNAILAVCFISNNKN